MQENILRKIEIPESLLRVLDELSLSPAELLKKLALDLVQEKIMKYEEEDREFRKKYTCDFDTFQKKLREMRNQEDFTKEDDLLDWQFAVENLQFWYEKHRLIEL